MKRAPKSEHGRDVKPHYKPAARHCTAIFSKKLLTFSRKSDIIFIVNKFCTQMQKCFTFPLAVFGEFFLFFLLLFQRPLVIAIRAIHVRCFISAEKLAVAAVRPANICAVNAAPNPRIDIRTTNRTLHFTSFVTLGSR